MKTEGWLILSCEVMRGPCNWWFWWTLLDRRLSCLCICVHKCECESVCVHTHAHSRSGRSKGLGGWEGEAGEVVCGLRLKGFLPGVWNLMIKLNERKTMSLFKPKF